MVLTGVHENGQAITNLETWFQHAPPQGGAKHWRDYRSAKELARAWLRPGQVCMPEELGQLFEHLDQTRGLEPVHAVAEMLIPFDQFRSPRNADLALWGQNAKKVPVVATIEGKADERFADTIGQTFDDANERGNARARISLLCQGIIGRELNVAIRPLRYQLFHALAATATLAARKGATIGVLVVHEFIAFTLDFDEIVQNANDLTAFAQAIPGWQGLHVETGKLLRPIRLPGSTSVPRDVLVSIGKVRSLVSVGSGGRIFPSITGGKSGQKLVLG